MPKSPEELQDRRNALAKAMETFQAENLQEDGHWQDAQSEGKWLELNNEYNEVMRTMEGHINRQRVMDDLERVRESQNAPVDPPRRVVPAGTVAGHDTPQPQRHANVAVKGWYNSVRRRHQSPDEQRDINAAMAQHGLQYGEDDGELFIESPSNDRIRQLQNEVRLGRGPSNTVFTTGTTATGGALVPAETFNETIERAMLYFGPMLQVSDIVTTSSGETLTWPMVNDTGNTGELLAESANADNSGSGDETGTWAQFQLDAYKYSSKAMIVPQELIEDARGDFVGTLSLMIGERLGRIQNTQFTTGTGSSQPNGIETAATTGKTAAAAGDIEWEEVMDLFHSVDIAYRQPPRAGFMANDLIVAHLRKLSDSQGRPIFSTGLNAGEPDLLAGRPLYINNDMTGTMATTTTSLLFGDYFYYKVRRVNGIRFYRMDERYRHNDQVGFIAFIRADGDLLNAGVPAVKALVHP